MPAVVFPVSGVRCGNDGSMWLSVDLNPMSGKAWEWIALDPALRMMGRSRPDNLWLLRPSTTSAITAKVNAEWVPTLCRMRVVRVGGRLATFSYYLAIAR